MNSPLSRALPLLCLMCSCSLAAQAPVPRWSAGVGMVLSDSPYAGEGQRLRAFPMLGWEGERFYFRGPDLGLRLLTDAPIQIDAALSARLDGFDARDLGRRELAPNGIDRDLLDDRSDGVDAAIKLRWPSEPLQFEAQIRHDISGASNGSELRLRVERAFAAGAWRGAPYLQTRWLSADLADYYHGLSEREVGRGLPAYRPGSVWQPELGLSVNRLFLSGWFLNINLRFSRLPDALADSPLLDDDSEAALFFALGKGF